MGWSCSLKGQPNFEGINQLEQIPILAVAATADPWRIGTSNQGRCAESIHAVKDFRQVDITGSFHDLYHSEQARDTIINFIKSNTK